MPLDAHAQWAPPENRTDPVETLIAQGKQRIPELLPERYARMRVDPFAFLRGAAAIMAADLAVGPSTGLRVQACGDCHLANFGTYATPEGTCITTWKWLRMMPEHEIPIAGRSTQCSAC